MSCDGNCESALRLRARIAAVEKERDALRACCVSKEALMLHGMTMEQAVEWRHKARALENERDAALARVKALEASEASLTRLAQENNSRIAVLEAALEPTAEGRQEYVVALMASADFDETEDAIVAMDGLLHAIRARAGLTKEGT